MIKNLTSKKKIVTKTRKAKSLTSRIRGLMFTTPLFDEGLVMIFPKEIIASLHMLFVFYPIDILWLDKHKKVVDLRKSVWPFIPYIHPRKRAKYVVELPIYSIFNSRTKIGDKISF